MVGRYGLWATDILNQSSNFQDLLNLVETIEEEGAAGSSVDTEIWLITDNVTAEERDHGVVLFLVHIAGTRMIAQGTDGLTVARRSTLRQKHAVTS